MAFQYTPIGHFMIAINTKADKLRQRGKVERTKQTINKAYLVKNHGLSYAHLVVHHVPGSKTEWAVSERFTGAKITKEPSKSRDAAVRAAITEIKMVGRSAYRKAVENYK